MRSGSTRDLAARRFSALALWCFVAMAASGVVNALVRIQLPELVRCRIRVVGDRQVRRAVCARLHRVAPASQRARGAEHRSGSPRAADPAGAGRGGRLRGDVRHRGRVGPHTATAAAAPNRVPSRSRSATTSPGRRPSRGCCSTGGSTSSSARRRSSWRCCICSGCAGCAVAATHGRWAARWRGCGLRGAAVHDVVGTGPLHARDVFDAHGGAHAAVRCWCRSCWSWAHP